MRAISRADLHRLQKPGQLVLRCYGTEDQRRNYVAEGEAKSLRALISVLVDDGAQERGLIKGNRLNQ